MIKLKIKNFGPIINGYENLRTDDFFDVSKCSVTYICYQSYIFDFEYKESKFSITQKNDLSKYNGKKVMYIPSERNLISVL